MPCNNSCDTQAEITELRAEHALAQRRIEDLHDEIERLQNLLRAWVTLGNDYECNSPAELGALIDIRTDALQQLQDDHAAMTQGRAAHLVAA